jgi:hypothetical protein
VTTLVRPAIYADQPWGSRRLVPGVLPGFVVLAVWAVSWLTRWLRERGTRPAIRYPVVGILALALLLPAAKTTFGIEHQDGGPLGTRLVAVGLADKVTYGGEIAAVQHLCAEIPADSSVLFVVRQTGGQLAEVVRGMCGDPAAVVSHPTRLRVRELIAGIQRAGRRPVLLGPSGYSLRKWKLGSSPVQVMNLYTRSDAHELVRPPLTTDQLTITVWMMEFAR